MNGSPHEIGPILVLGGTGKTGRRVVERLRARGIATRVGSRFADPPFDWENRATWAPALAGVRTVYLTYYPDLAAPGAAEATEAFAELAVQRGASRIVLLSARGEPRAESAEEAVRGTGAALTIVRSTWFMQNFSEDYLRHDVVGGELRLPAGDVPTPFVDADDLADVAVAALIDDRHVGQLHELTGPRSLTHREIAAEIAAAIGRELRYTPVTLDEYEASLVAHGVDPGFIEVLPYLYREVMDGRNVATTDGVRRALRREAREFAEYARKAAASGAWDELAVAA
ncbi:MAG TPA: NmrA family NAD(P)-binding protein [Thermoleophilaceae bacterium]|nr:NmrA family NAD(P)-binding protein [Thermoleophilaceae bacterium]